MDIVIYYRVSTKRQGQSGLGLEAQHTAVHRFQTAEGYNVLASFTEVESGKKSRRPELTKAIALCKGRGAILVVAKLDRLSRNVAFTSALMDSGVEFICCDMPSANRTTIQMMAVMAEDEARRISDRTRVSLAELKAEGEKLGSARPDHWDRVAQKHGRNMRGWGGMDPVRKAANIKDRFRETYKNVIPLVETLAERGEPVGQIACTLNARGMKTSKGADWTPSAVSRVISKLETT